VWSGEEYPEAIRALPEGKPVVLKSDISQCKHGTVKFNQVGIKFECGDGQAALNDALVQYFVNMTHSGRSFYK